MPSFDGPNCRICRCNFQGSAPPDRLGGRRSSAGSTSRIAWLILIPYIDGRRFASRTAPSASRQMSTDANHLVRQCNAMSGIVRCRSGPSSPGRCRCRGCSGWSANIAIGGGGSERCRKRERPKFEPRMKHRLNTDFKSEAARLFPICVQSVFHLWRCRLAGGVGRPAPNGGSTRGLRTSSPHQLD